MFFLMLGGSFFLGGFRGRSLDTDLIVFGEVGLAGEVRPVPNGEERLEETAGEWIAGRGIAGHRERLGKENRPGLRGEGAAIAGQTG